MNSTNLEISINTLRDCTVEMIEKCEDILKLSIESVINRDLKSANEVSVKDKEINEFREYIRDKSIELLALRQPMAKDLRYVYSLAIIVKELERIGDYAKNIAEEVVEIEEPEYVKELVDIPKMYEQCMLMLKETKVALVNEDVKLAKDTANRDNIIDEIYKQVRIDCLDIMNNNHSAINQCVRLLFIARHLERVGDHITNICEKIVYVAEGEMIDIG